MSEAAQIILGLIFPIQDRIVGQTETGRYYLKKGLQDLQL